jgi:hypothetical protein
MFVLTLRLEELAERWFTKVKESKRFGFSLPHVAVILNVFLWKVSKTSLLLLIRRRYPYIF